MESGFEKVGTLDYLVIDVQLSHIIELILGYIVNDYDFTL